MAKLLQGLGVVFLLLAVLGIAALLIFDGLNGLQLTQVHRDLGAWSFMLIGASYVVVLLSSRKSFNAQRKEFALGIAFILWGCEPFVPSGSWATAIDAAVIAIFVIELAAAILARLKDNKCSAEPDADDAKRSSIVGKKILGTELANGAATLNAHEQMP